MRRIFIGVTCLAFVLGCSGSDSGSGSNAGGGAGGAPAASAPTKGVKQRGKSGKGSAFPVENTPE